MSSPDRGVQSPEAREAGGLKGKPEILDGHEGKDLFEGAVEYEFASGDRAIAATDKGVDYKDGNEDRIVVKPEESFFAVLDGVGGHTHGQRAADILAEKLHGGSANVPSAVKEAEEQMALEQQRDNWGKLGGGACFISGRLIVSEGKKFLSEVYQKGDCAILVYDIEGNIVFESKDHTSIQEGVDEGYIKPDQALYSPIRSVVTRAVMSHPHGELAGYEPIELKPGYRIVALSDGISDNLTPQEIWQLIKGLNAREAMKVLSDVTTTRMINENEILSGEHVMTKRMATGKFSDGFRSAPKPDNRALLILDIAA